MGAGDIIKEALLVVEKVLVKAQEDIELGEVIYNDGAGFLAMTSGIVNAKAYIALEAHTYADESEHYIRAAPSGLIEVQKIAGTAIKEGQLVAVGGTAGEVELFTKGDAPTGGVSTYYTTSIEAGVQTALDNNLQIVGTCAANASSGATTVKTWVGVK